MPRRGVPPTPTSFPSPLPSSRSMPRPRSAPASRASRSPTRCWWSIRAAPTTTVEIAERHGARVDRQGMAGLRPAEAVRGVDREARLGAVPRRGRARDRARWPRSIREALASRRYNAYRMARRNRFLGRWLAHGEGYPDWTAAPLPPRARELVQRRGARGRAHDRGSRAASTGDLLHDSAEDVATYLAKQNRYTTLHAEALYQPGRARGLLAAVREPAGALHQVLRPARWASSTAARASRTS